jgi:hypothetical protein
MGWTFAGIIVGAIVGAGLGCTDPFTVAECSGTVGPASGAFGGVVGGGIAFVLEKLSGGNGDG